MVPAYSKEVRLLSAIGDTSAIRSWRRCEALTRRLGVWDAKSCELKAGKTFWLSGEGGVQYTYDSSSSKISGAADCD
jgi:hypothetical protein